MRLGVRGKLFLVSLALILTGGLTAGLWLEGELRGTLEGRIEEELLARAVLVGTMMEGLPPSTDRGTMDALADRFGEASGSRITLIGPDGFVLGDSQVDVARLAGLDDHGDRPEIVAAREHGTGQARRYSATLQEEMVYAAARVDADGRPHFARVATPLDTVSAAVARLRVAMGLAAALLILVAVFMSMLASWLLERVLTGMVEHAWQVRAGDDPHEEIGRLAGSVERLTRELDRNLDVLAGERARFETVLDSMTEAVVAVGADGIVQVVNRAALRMLGLDAPPEDQSLEQVLAVPELAGIAAKARQGGIVSLEFDQRGPPERRVLLRAAADKDGAGVVIVLLDVTEMRHLERVRRDFVANVSHELRTPVAVIRANSETLLEGALEEPEAAGRFVRAIERHAERLSRLIDDLLDIARIEAGRNDLELAPVLLEDLARRCAEGLQERARQRDLTIEVDVPAGLTVLADERALDQVLLNLLENAVRYNTTGAHVAVRARVSGSVVRVEVEDDGPGLPEVEQSRLFERFYRVDRGRSREHGGTGLGLSIVKHLVEAMGGKVGVESTLGEGATFIVELQPAG